jgi:DNA-directed RNA polymerase III subunit RPC1
MAPIPLPGVQPLIPHPPNHPSIALHHHTHTNTLNHTDNNTPRQVCSRVLLDEPARRSYLRKLRNPSLDDIQRKDILRSLNVACKKLAVCHHCQGINGTVKKVGALKLVHEKFKKKTKTEEEAAFKDSFQHAVTLDPALKHHVHKAQEDLSPLLVLRLFERISNEDCELLGMKATGRPELFIWSSLPIPPVCIRPSVGQEESRWALVGCAVLLLPAVHLPVL